MQKIKKNSGLALGTVLALVVSLFAGIAPAQATNEAVAVITPRGAGDLTANSMIHTETFELFTRYGSSVAGVGSAGGDLSQGTAAGYNLFYSISSESNNVQFMIDADGDFSNGTAVTGTSVSASLSDPTAAATGYFAVTSTSPYVSVGIADATSASSAVSITLTPYFDNDGVTGYSDGDSKGTAYTVNFVPWSTLGGSVSFGTLVMGDGNVTVSASVTEGTIRWSQLDGQFGVHIASSNDTETGDSGTLSADTVAAADPSKTATQLDTLNFSLSASVATQPLVEDQTMSAYLVYIAAPVDNATIAATEDMTTSRILASAAGAVADLAVAGLTLSPVTSANVIETGAAASARYNSAFTLTAFPYSASVTTSVAVASAFTVSAVGNGIDFDVDSGVVIDGTTYTSSAAFLAAGFTLPAGDTSIDISTFGQASGGTDTLTFALSAQLASVTLVVTLEAAAYTAVYSPTAVAGLAGASKTFEVAVRDQFGQAPVRTDLRVLASMALASSTSTAAAAVTGGVASVTLAPTPDTRTGSGTVTFQIQNFDQSTQAWVNLGTTDSATWNVYTYAAGTDAFESRTATASASISYGVSAYSWSGVVSVEIANSFSDIVVSAPGLVIENNDQASQTGSDTLTVAANGVNGNFRFASKLAGTYTVTFTSGTASTTSLITIDAAGEDKGATITFDKSSIAAGETTTITGTLRDANGNPVKTAGTTASVAVTYTGKGLPYGMSSTMATDANGQFTFQVLVLSTEKGDAAVSATYKPTGSETYTGNITTVQAITVGAASSSADQKVNAGSFKGYVAVYAKGYEGQRLSAKVGNDWVVVESLASNFERVVEFTGAGYTIAVRIYIDRVLVDTITVTTK